MEFALALRALRKVGGLLGTNIRPVYWKGMVAADSRFIFLDPGDVKGTYPISSTGFDRLVGQVVLEGLSSMEWREWVLDRVLKHFSQLDEDAAAYLENLLQAAEDIYIHELTGSTVWRYYLSMFFRKMLNGDQRDPSLPPRPESLAAIWRRNMIIGTIPAPSMLHPYYWESLKILSHFTVSIRSIAAFKTPAERRNARKTLYIEMGNKIIEAISKWEPFFLSPNAMGISGKAGVESKESSQEPDGDRLAEDDGEKDDGLGEELAGEINEIMAESVADVTKTIKVAVEDPEAGIMPTRFQKGEADSDMFTDADQVERLRVIFREQAALIRRSRKFIKRRGMPRGKLDSRRLYRYVTNGNMFVNKEKQDSDHLWQICILADASSSMGATIGRLETWDVAQRTFASLAEAVKGTDNILDIYAYAEDRGTCVLTQLYHGGRLYSILPGGRTPSGQAIMASAVMQKPGGRKRILIHITDGAANCGISISDALRYCSANGINVFNIGCGCTKQTRDFLSQNFPDGNLFFLQDIKFLAKGIERLFRQNFLKA
jgi:hypothetical protein